MVKSNWVVLKEIKSQEGSLTGLMWYLAKMSLRSQPSHNHFIQLLRSLVVSFASLAADISVLLFAKEVAGIYYLWSVVLGFVTGVLVNYYLSNKWVFPTRKLSSRNVEFTVFLLICAVGIGLNMLIIAGMVELFAFDYRVAKLVSAAIVFFWNFAARKKILY